MGTAVAPGLNSTWMPTTRDGSRRAWGMHRGNSADRPQAEAVAGVCRPHPQSHRHRRTRSGKR